MQSVQKEVEYCGQYVTESRRKLVEEFDKWYRVAFVGENTTDHEKSIKVSFHFTNNGENQERKSSTCT